MDSTQISAELVGSTQAQRARIAGRAVMRVLPLLAIKAGERPFDYWPGGKRVTYVHVLFRLLLPALTDKVKVALTTSELARIAHDSSQQAHVQHLVQAVRNVGRIMENHDYPAMCEAMLAALQRSEEAVNSAVHHYIVGSDYYDTLKEEKYSVVEQERYTPVTVTAYSSAAVGTYSAVPSDGGVNPAAEQLIRDLEEMLRRDILHIGSRDLHDRPLPAGIPLWHQSAVPAMINESGGRMIQWLTALGGDCPRWGQLYQALLRGQL